MVRIGVCNLQSRTSEMGPGGSNWHRSSPSVFAWTSKDTKNSPKNLGKKQIASNKYRIPDCIQTNWTYIYIQINGTKCRLRSKFINQKFEKEKELGANLEKWSTWQYFAKVTQFLKDSTIGSTIHLIASFNQIFDRWHSKKCKPQSEDMDVSENSGTPKSSN